MGLIPLKESLMFRLEERCSSHFQGVDFRFTIDSSSLPQNDTSTYKRCPLTSSHVTAWGLFFSKGNGQRAARKASGLTVTRRNLPHGLRL
jgi:hypothetical protein